jgi:RimJ/RimL family protein N-acetyltransferase
VGPAYRIHTPRLVIRCWEPRDAPELKAAIDQSLDHLRAWMPWARQEPQPLEAKIEFLRRKRGEFDLGQDFSYGIFDRGQGEVLGSTGLHPRVGPDAREIGYWIRQDQIGRGLATEATAALTNVAFTVDRVSRVEIHCSPDNAASLAVPRKLGFQHEATLKERFPLEDGGRRDTMIWTLFAAQFGGSPAAAAKVEAFDAAGRVLAT